MWERPMALWLVAALTSCAGQPSSERSTRIAAPAPEPESPANDPPSAMTGNADSEPSGTECAREYEAAMERCDELSLGCPDSQPECDTRLLMDGRTGCFTDAEHNLALCRCLRADAGPGDCDDPPDANPTE